MSPALLGPGETLLMACCFWSLRIFKDKSWCEKNTKPYSCFAAEVDENIFQDQTALWVILHLQKVFIFCFNFYSCYPFLKKGSWKCLLTWTILALCLFKYQKCSIAGTLWNVFLFPAHSWRLCQVSSLKVRGDFLSAAWHEAVFVLHSKMDITFYLSSQNCESG